MHNGIQLSVYYHTGHDWNVPKMLNAMGTALDYYRAHFGPYQFNYARIIEFPGYDSFAQAFAGTMPYSESIGFNANTDDPDKIDFTTYVIAHEMAHQYWAHQVIGADMQGGHDDQRDAGAIFGADGDEAPLRARQDPPLPQVRAR